MGRHRGEDARETERLSLKAYEQEKPVGQASRKKGKSWREKKEAKKRRAGHHKMARNLSSGAFFTTLRKEGGELKMTTVAGRKGGAGRVRAGAGEKEGRKKGLRYWLS